MKLTVAASAVLAIIASGLIAESRAQSQPYPSKSVRLLVTWPPGGGTDAIGRIMAQKFTAAFNQQFVVDNRPGAGGTIGMNLLAKAAPDGYTIGMMISSHAVNAGIYPSLPYDSVEDFAPIALLARGLYVLVVNPGVAARSVKELIALAKSAPGKLNVANAGTGTPSHLGIEQFKSLAGVDIVMITYKGSGPAVIDTIGGQAQLMFASLPSVQQQVKAGRLHALAVAGARRSSAVPDLPTMAESGVPGYDVSEWYGMAAPAKTPAAVMSRLNDEIQKILLMPDVKERLASLGAETVSMGPAPFSSFVRSEVVKWTKVVKEAGIKPE